LVNCKSPSNATTKKPHWVMVLVGSPTKADGAHDRTDDRTLADQRYDALIARIDKNQAITDQRHTQIMAQFEKLLAKPSEK
jgi:hypothetical protein